MRFLPALLLLCSLAALPAQEKMLRRPENLSVRNEVQGAIDKSLGWLVREQATDGSWAGPSATGQTALTTLACLGASQPSEAAIGAAQRGLAFLRVQAQANGSFGTGPAATADTALGLLALLYSHQPEDAARAQRAQQYLAARQAAGGGFGEEGGDADLIRTAVAVEALCLYPRALPEAGAAWDRAAAAGYLERVLAAHGFSSAKPSGTAHYLALLSLLHLVRDGSLPADAPALVAAIEAARQHFTLRENPGQGRTHFHLYLHLLAHALAVVRVRDVEIAPGQKGDWAQALALQLINTQSSAGTWADGGGEDGPVAVTTHALLALEIVFREL